MEDDRRSKSKQKTVEEEEEEEEEENNEALKRRISTHPLYSLLLDSHMDCLKVGSIIKAEIEQGKTGMRLRDHTRPSTSIDTQSELDHFMEAYCKALSKLKEAMEEPQQETVAFINDMHSQLRDLTNSNPPPNTSSGK
ncbi:hypothetical protein QYF36_023024 [Acer negundo]|nr:hypothetical protein QYF36_023024 [Acer negundo]